MHSRVTAIAALLVAACTSLPSEVRPTPDIGFVGTWGGIGATTIGPLSRADLVDLRAGVSGTALVLAGMCPDGSGYLAAPVDGKAGSWSADLSCGSIKLGDCPSTAVALLSADVALSDEGTGLIAHFGGTAIGCGIASDVTIGFAGSKQ